jgi:Ni/Co efflux regulator RcnB
MKKLVLALATVATLGLSTAAFAEDPTSTQQRVQPAHSQTPVSHNVKASHRIGVRKVVVRHDRGLHHGFLHSRHYGYDKGKKVVIKHTPTNRTLKTKAAS